MSVSSSFGPLVLLRKSGLVGITRGFRQRNVMPWSERRIHHYNSTPQKPPQQLAKKDRPHLSMQNSAMTNPCATPSNAKAMETTTPKVQGKTRNSTAQFQATMACFFIGCLLGEIKTEDLRVHVTRAAPSSSSTTTFFPLYPSLQLQLHSPHQQKRPL